MKCYCASFNVGKIEVWASDLFFNKKDVLIDIEESLEEIVEEISGELYLEEEEIIKSLNHAIQSMKKNGIYKDKDKNFDFFILEQYIWKNRQDREIFTKNIKMDNEGINN
jgi:hypothetical protein